MEAYELIDWIGQHYGRLGIAVFGLLVITLFVLIIYLLSQLNNLVKPKDVIWSKCYSCKYNLKETKSFIMTCPQYEKGRWIQFREPPCPNPVYTDCKVINVLSNPDYCKKEYIADTDAEVIQKIRDIAVEQAVDEYLKRITSFDFDSVTMHFENRKNSASAPREITICRCDPTEFDFDHETTTWKIIIHWDDSTKIYNITH